VVLERTNCYAESGGQLYDVGRIEGPSGGFDFANVQVFRCAAL
jgi:alanyl-tRNA synthetase